MDHFVYLQDEDGTPVGPINVTQGLNENYLVLESDPGITLRTGQTWKTLFAFGHNGDSGSNPDAPRIAIVQQRSANSLRTASLDLLFDHPYVHEDPGTAPTDPYATNSEIPDLSLTGLTASAVYGDGILLDESGEPLLDESGEYLLDETGSTGVVIHVEWDAVSGATSYQLRWKLVSVAGWHYASTIGTSIDFAATVAPGTYNIHVKALSTTYVGPESVVLLSI
jgi:hypothetical protein